MTDRSVATAGEYVAHEIYQHISPIIDIRTAVRGMKKAIDVLEATDSLNRSAGKDVLYPAENFVFVLQSDNPDYMRRCRYNANGSCWTGGEPFITELPHDEQQPEAFYADFLLAYGEQVAAVNITSEECILNPLGVTIAIARQEQRQPEGQPTQG